jgi:hypothetical protein
LDPAPRVIRCPPVAITPSSFGLSADLRALRHRGERTSHAKGTLQLQLTQSIGDPSIFEAASQGSIQNPEREHFLRGAITFIGDPNVLPAELQAELAGIALIGDPNLSQRFGFAGAQPVSDRLAAVMFEDPEAFLVTLYTSEHPGGAIGGVFMGDGSV